MSSTLPNITDVAVVTSLEVAGNANSNGVVALDLSGYKGPVTFALAVGHITTGLGAANLPVARIEESSDNSVWTNVSGGSFTAVVNAANVSNVGVQTVSFEARELDQYVRSHIEVTGTNANVPVSVVAIGQLQRT